MRPDGPLRIDTTDNVSKNVLAGHLSGAFRGTVYAVQVGKRFYLAAPEKLGGTREVPAVSLTDCLNYEVGVIGRELDRSSKSKKPAPRGKKGRVQECGP